MTLRRSVLFALAAAAALAATYSRPTAQTSSGTYDQKLFGELRWRNIGPYRGGRTKAAAGAPQQPYTFYIGVVNGGVWKTTDAGHTWKPIFDSQPTGSIGSIAVAASDPNVVYVGSGEGLARPDLSVGDGVYKSTDAGKTWTHLGLRDGQQIPAIAIDRNNPNRLFVAVAGHPYGPNEERGIFRSTDGGQTFQKVLYKDENVGGNDVDIDPSNPNIVYATLWEERQGPWENAQWRGTGGGIYRSTDGGSTWTPLTKGLPGNGAITQANLAIAPGNPKRLYATVASGPAVTFYRSDDAGESWTRATEDTRPTGRIGGGDLAMPLVGAKDADTVIMASTVSYKSTDGGRTWVPFKGAPGGDDYQNGWINPDDPNIILLASDQGAVVTLNGGASWSSWYNQPTAQLYHVNTDNDFPYRVCSGQQESGSACVASRGNDGQITFREWHPVGVEEYGYAVPDPLNPDIVYGGKVSRYDRRTSQNQGVGPTPGRGGPPAPPGAPTYRTVRTQPVAFSPVSPDVLFYANNYLWKTIDGGINWTRISDDPTRKTYDLPKTIGKYGDPSLVTQRGVIYSIAPSYLDINRIWFGTDDGVIKTTADGGTTWKDVTPPTMTPWMKVFNMDAGRFDALTAYAAGNTLRLDDMRPHLFRTHDGGKTWTAINAGLEEGGPTSSIREDPTRKGLLYAATERRVYVSFDDGDHWQSLQLNMAPSSVRDLTIKDDDLIAATHGRGFWILDNITPLRQIDRKVLDADAFLFKPQTALRVRWNTNTDTPLPPDEPNAPNPPEGAIVDYYLKSAARGPLTLDVVGSDGRLVRHYSSADPVTRPDPATSSLPLYWFRPPVVLSTEPGLHRFTWDVHYQPLAGGGGGGRGGLPIAAAPNNTVPAPTTPWVAPGTYTVKLTVNGKTYSQPITVKQDPRVKTSRLMMQQIYWLTKAAYDGAVDAQSAVQQAQGVRAQIASRLPDAKGAVAEALTAFDKKVEALIGSVAGPGGGRGGRGGRGGATPAQGVLTVGRVNLPPGAPAGPPATQPPGGRGAAPVTGGPPDTLAGAGAALASVMNSLGVDVRPTALALTAINNAQANAVKARARWTAVKTVDLPPLNAKLKQAGLKPLVVDDEALEKKARAIHERVIALDTHDDISANNFTPERNYTKDLGNQVNLPKMVSGGLDAAFFIVYVGQGPLTPEGYDNAYKQAVEKFDAIHRLTGKIAPEKIGLALTSADVRRINASGRKVALIGVENGYSLGDDTTALARVKEFYDRGARYLSLSHNGHSQLSDSNTGEVEGWKWNGLSPLGKQVVAEANKVGLMIDVSHPSKESMMQTLQITKAPIIASHSAVRALADVSRNLDDEQLLALKKNGGIIQVVGFASYVKTDSPERRAALNALRKEFGLPNGTPLGGGRGGGRGGAAAAAGRGGTGAAAGRGAAGAAAPGGGRAGGGGRGAALAALTDAQREDLQKKLAAIDEKFPSPTRATVKDFVDHIDYAVQKIGIDHVGISSDFDGGGGVTGWNGADETFSVTLELMRRGYTEAEIAKIWSGNLMRVMDDVQRIAKQLQRGS
ncbi:MAG: hypothetical protein A3H96_07045 [Acidobacteria bacterium RIFCSPLOWO2_02_FULL_67_36]|nr:MAG: hypothetical protein A3H96_07045 [Acidobacteria bacterium RIFCSPLOWO2_02_FULL_67_36]OFW26518.1 MAG: hypothetical protein A3G21_24275 [Acidobacteria bacterium RIFCSPLOWO2_12_FULL_66_21]